MILFIILLIVSFGLCYWIAPNAFISFTIKDRIHLSVILTIISFIICNAISLIAISTIQQNFIARTTYCAPAVTETHEIYSIDPWTQYVIFCEEDALHFPTYLYCCYDENTQEKITQTASYTPNTAVKLNFIDAATAPTVTIKKQYLSSDLKSKYLLAPVSNCLVYQEVIFNIPSDGWTLAH